MNLRRIFSRDLWLFPLPKDQRWGGKTMMRMTIDIATLPITATLNRPQPTRITLDLIEGPQISIECQLNVSEKGQAEVERVKGSARRSVLGRVEG
jgi:hypothetical protein